MIQRIKGTQDFLDLTLFNYLLTKAHKHLELYNFKEIATPILEPLDLFKRSLGLETDVVTKEMFVIKGDDEDQICLRPEVTASIARAFLEHGGITTPWKVYTWGPMFRHERPQKGRYRQFHQISIEVIGSQSIDQDAQFLKMLDRFFHEDLRLNTYALLINFLGCAADRVKYREKLRAFVEKLGTSVCSTCMIRKDKNVMRVVDCKNPSCQELYKKVPQITDSLCEICAGEWQRLRDVLELLSVSYSVMPTLVRGLDYYDKTVFEFVSAELGAQNTFCGGGRYNTLMGQLGAKEEQPSLGASIGIERVMLLLEASKNGLPVSVQPPLTVVVSFTPEQHALALLIADELQAKGYCTDVLLEGDSIKSMMRRANKMGAKYALLLGPDEQQSKMVTVKNMMTGAEEKVAQKEVASRLS
jgi:histidyl-tRNA synthetase